MRAAGAELDLVDLPRRSRLALPRQRVPRAARAGRPHAKWRGTRSGRCPRAARRRPPMRTAHRHDPRGSAPRACPPAA